jgi:maleylacetoacetate isomerase
MLTLYGYYRSSATFRVRIALNLKGLSYERRGVHLRKGEQSAADYRRLNPQELVPTLVDGDTVLGQSLAITEYLDDTRPEPPLLPPDAAGRARTRALALLVACDIHPLNNLRVLTYLTRDLGLAAADEQRWYCHWITRGFAAMEQQLDGNRATGRYCHGDRPTLADVFLVPQVFNARYRKCDLTPYPTIRRIADQCMTLKAFADAAPEAQPDRE